MKYYQLTNSSNCDEVGIFPQCTEARNIYNIQEWGLGNYEAIQKDFILPEPILRKKTITTNLLGVIPIDSLTFKVVDDSLLFFLATCNRGPYQSWKLKTYTSNGNIINLYNLFHLSSPVQDELIDFSKSKFLVSNFQQENFGVVTFNNYAEYHKMWLEVLWEAKFIKYDELHLSFDNFRQDLFRINNLRELSGYYVSDRLRDAIIEKGFTGFSYKGLESNNKLKISH